MNVRLVREADFEQWKPLWAGYNAFYGRSGATALDDAITTMTWQRCFDIVDGAACAVKSRIVYIECKSALQANGREPLPDH